MSAENSELTKPNGDAPPAQALCSACAKPLPPGAERCPSCGIVVGEQHRCVHCRAIVDVDSVPEVRFVCRLCGGVRIPLDDAAIERSAAQIELLKRATVARSASHIWRAVAAAVAAFGAASVLVLWLVVSVASPETTPTVMAGLAATIPFVFAALAFRKSRIHQAEIGRLIDAAWMAAATDVARAHGGKIDVRTFAKVTRASEGSADELLGRMGGQGLLTRSETPEGALQYTLADANGGAPRALASGD